MAHIREDIKKGQYAPGQDTIDVDARYSNQTHSGISNTPYQAATHADDAVSARELDKRQENHSS